MDVEEQRDRSTGRSSAAVVVVLVAAAAMWGYYLVAAVAKGAYGLAALNGVALVGTVWTLSRIVARRRRRRLGDAPESSDRTDATRGDALRPTRGDVVRLVAFLVFAAVFASYLISTGLDEVEKSGELKIIGGSLILLCILVIALASIRELVRRRRRR